MSVVDALRRQLGLDAEKKEREEAEQRAKAIVHDYREVFRRPEGRRVFIHMIRELGLFEIAATPEETALKNYGTRLVMRLGLTSTEDLCNAILDCKYQED